MYEGQCPRRRGCGEKCIVQERGAFFPTIPNNMDIAKGKLLLLY